MKKAIALFVFAAVTVLAQPSSPSFGMWQGTAAVTASGHPCNGSQNVGSLYTRIANPSVTYVCSQIGANSLGTGAFGWVSVPKSGSGTGSVNVAAGKTLTVSNSLTLAGTDATTVTFPSTSITVPGTVVSNCGTANACSATTVSPTSKVVYGVTAALDGASPSVAAVTGMPAFTSSSSYTCTANANSAAATTVILAVNRVSSSAVTFTGPNGATATVSYICIGN